MMVEQPRQLGRCALGREFFLQQRRRLRDLFFVIRGFCRLTSASGPGSMDEVIDQANAVTLGNRPHLVLAIRVKRRKTQFGNLRPAQINRNLPSRVTYDQLATAVCRRETDDKRAKHASRLFRVPMRKKEPAQVIHKEFVELSRNRKALAAESGDDLLKDSVKICRPRFAAHPDSIRQYLPHFAN